MLLLCEHIRHLYMRLIITSRKIRNLSPPSLPVSFHLPSSLRLPCRSRSENGCVEATPDAAPERKSVRMIFTRLLMRRIPLDMNSLVRRKTFPAKLVTAPMTYISLKSAPFRALAK